MYYDHPFVEVNRDGVDLLLVESDCGLAIGGTQDDVGFGWLAEYSANLRKV